MTREQTSFDFDDINTGNDCIGVDTAKAKAPPVTWLNGFLTADEQNQLIAESQSYPFTRPEIEVYGKTHPIPRQQVWFADEECSYRYASLFITPVPWPPILAQLRSRLELELGIYSNGVLVNYYENGQDTVGWHSDDEAEICQHSAIASISLGATRDFMIRHKRSQETFTLALAAGDLLIMQPGMQQTWQHALPRRAKVMQSRLNLTFRMLVVGVN
jgi:alkylated DNA repair dioxygenase AlkB